MLEDMMKIVFSVLPIVIPVVAIIGGITLAIIRTVGQQRLAELERRERIAAIERGIDPAALPPPSMPGAYENGHGAGNRTRRAHGLLIGGLVTVATGAGLAIFLSAVEPNESHWTLGFLPIFVGLALLVSARFVWPRDPK
ncbi:MAG TPA: DUF6249 domain-containing protein [Acidobacteriota bacterium]|nr:DUF6249 domain-containing protein [Acidobacteriota bacterium]